MRFSNCGNYVPQKKPRHCPVGHRRCSMCNRLMKVDDASVEGPLLCERCVDDVKPPAETAISVMPSLKADYGRTPRDKNDPSRWPELAAKAPKRKRVRTTAKRVRASRAVIRNEDGMRFANVQEAAKVTSGGAKGPSSLYAHLQGKNKTFCGCTFRYEDKGES